MHFGIVPCKSKVVLHVHLVDEKALGRYGGDFWPIVLAKDLFCMLARSFSRKSACVFYAKSGKFMHKFEVI